MKFLCFFSRSAHFDSSTFIKKFSGKRVEFKKLKKEELACLLSQGFTEQSFPIEMFIDYLVEIKWNFNEKLSGGCLPLNSACAYGNVQIVKKIIEAGADVHAKDANQVGSLHHACRSGNSYLVEYLLSINVDMNSRDTSGFSPIFSAAEYGHYDIFTLLLEKGADIKTPNTMGITLLHSATRHNSIEMVEKLIDMGLDISVEDNFGKTS